MLCSKSPSQSAHSCPNSAISCHRRKTDSATDGLNDTLALTRDSDHQRSIDGHDHGTTNRMGTAFRHGDGHPRRQRAAIGHRIGVVFLERT